jgi:hypothetical protein
MERRVAEGIGGGLLKGLSCHCPGGAEAGIRKGLAHKYQSNALPLL